MKHRSFLLVPAALAAVLPSPALAQGSPPPPSDREPASDDPPSAVESVDPPPAPLPAAPSSPPASPPPPPEDARTASSRTSLRPERTTIFHFGEGAGWRPTLFPLQVGVPPQSMAKVDYVATFGTLPIAATSHLEGAGIVGVLAGVTTMLGGKLTEQPGLIEVGKTLVGLDPRAPGRVAMQDVGLALKLGDLWVGPGFYLEIGAVPGTGGPPAGDAIAYGMAFNYGGAATAWYTGIRDVDIVGRLFAGSAGTQLAHGAQVEVVTSLGDGCLPALYVGAGYQSFLGSQLVVAPTLFVGLGS